jgi:probable glucitol transport protein GutA
MVAAMAVSISFPMLMNRIATSPAGWSALVAMVAVPAGLIGILRFVFVKETVMIEEHEEKPRLTDVFTLMKKNHYVWIVTLMWLVFGAYPKIPKWQRKNPGESFNAGFFRCLGYNFGICS